MTPKLGARETDFEKVGSLDLGVVVAQSIDEVFNVVLLQPRSSAIIIPAEGRRQLEMQRYD